MISRLHVSEGDEPASGYRAWQSGDGIELRVWGEGHEVVRWLSVEEARHYACRVLDILDAMARKRGVSLAHDPGVNCGVAGAATEEKRGATSD